MLLKDYIPNLSKINRKIFFSGISFDSSKVKKNFIFFAIKGSKYDGNSFVKEAIKNGAKIIVSEKKFPKKEDNVVYLKVPNVRKLLSCIAYKIIKKKPKKLIAVTGTNGKSSVADFYYQILTTNKIKVAAIGTVGIKFKNQKRISKTTTLDPIELSLTLKKLKKDRIDFVIMEASSHGLKQHRLDGLLFDIGIFTNFSHDHLDYHKNIRDYLKSKLYLFKKLIKKKGSIISDMNIPQKKEIERISLKNKLNLKLIFNNKNGIELISHKFENEKQILEIKFKSQKFKFELNLIGKIQIKNLLMAILAAYKSGLKLKNIIGKIDRIKSVEGRLEKIGKIKNNSRVILDYAHTPEALDLALSSLQEQFPKSKISLVFGCGGNRDTKKRVMMGRIADKYSKNIYLTNDNPRYENPSKIRIDIKKGIKNNKLHELPNRKEAIQKAVMSLATGDILLVAGRGHEIIQDFGDKKLFFSDKKIILNSIKKKK